MLAGEFVEREMRARGDGPLPWQLLIRGFDVDGHRVPLVSMQGIFRPAILPEIPLSIRTAAPDSSRAQPYNDGFDPATRLWRYHYRDGGVDHPDNRGLRLAMERQVPLVYFQGVVPGWYAAAWPSFIVEDRRAERVFEVAVDDPGVLLVPPGAAPPGDAVGRRAYVTAVTRRRVHQQGFRLRVLRAYRECCAVCRLRHEELLEAAHILPDSHPRGEPIVPNGLALCGLHHAAFDRHILGIRPDLTIDLRMDVLEETDGPMLQHGLQGFHGGTIRVPRASELQPDREFLEERYAMFRRAS
jgi:putative restriction endonuclease